MESHPVSSNRGAIVAGGLLVVLGIFSLISQFVTGFGLVVWAGALALLGIVVFGYSLTDRSQQWVMIPAYILVAIAGLLFLISTGLDEGAIIPTYVLSAVGLPFLYGFFRNTRNWGLLIPAYVLFTVAVMIYLIETGFLSELGIPAYVNFAIALPFLLVFALNPKHWWALIPGGILGSVAVGFLLGTDLVKFGIPAVLILAGLIVLFVPVLRRTPSRLAAGKEPDSLLTPASEPMPEIEKTPER